ncbi:hypothetical protein ACWD27_32580, partial [Streptomyces sp. NPDC002758]
DAIDIDVERNMLTVKAERRPVAKADRRHDAPSLRDGPTPLLRKEVDGSSLRDDRLDFSEIQPRNFAPQIPESAATRWRGALPDSQSIPLKTIRIPNTSFLESGFLNSPPEP